MKEPTGLKRGLSLILLALPLVLVSCASTPQVPQPAVIKSEGPYAIGDRGPAGGWIFHDKGDSAGGWRYLEAAAEDQSTGWSMGEWAFAELDPYDLQRQIVAEADYDVATLWQALGIAPDMETVYPRLGIAAEPPERFESCRGDCTAEVHPLQWGAEAEQTVALTISQATGLCRYLLFRQVRATGPEGAAWRFIGQADHDFARHRPPEHRTETLGGSRYFVMTAQGASGTGVSLEYERWYEVSSAGLREVLSFPRSGHECPSAQSLCRSFSAQVDREKSDSGRIAVTFRIDYQGNRFLLDNRSFEELPLLTKQRQAVYIPAGDTGDFLLWPGESEITAEEIRRTSMIGEFSCEDFLRYNGEALRRLTAGPQGEVRAWLERYLSDCGPSDGGNCLREVPDQ